jgi:hypothetical protein
MDSHKESLLFIYSGNIYGGLNYHKAVSWFWGATVPMGLRLPSPRKPSQAGMIAESTHRRSDSIEKCLHISGEVR